MPETSFSTARRKAKLTNGQIAKQLGVSESYISKIMHGARQPHDIEVALRHLLKMKSNGKH